MFTRRVQSWKQQPPQVHTLLPAFSSALSATHLRLHPLRLSSFHRLRSRHFHRPNPARAISVRMASSGSGSEDEHVMEASDWMKYNPLTAVVEQSAPPKGAPLPHLREFPRAPRPDAARVFTQNGVRIQALNDRLIRIEYSRDRVFEDRASFTFPIRDVSDSDSLGPLTSEYDESSGVLSVATPLVKVEVATQKESFDPAMVTATALTGDKAVHPFLSDDAPTSGKFLLEGTCRTLDEADGFFRRDWGTHEKTGNVLLQSSVLARGGVVFIDDSRRGLFTDDGWFAQRRFPSGSDQYRDLYVLVSNPSPAEGDATSPQDYRGALRAYSQAAGGTPMLPRRFLGNWWSRYYKYTEKSLGDLILKFEELEVPLSVTIIDMDWHIVDSAKDISGPDCHGWTGYTWNKEFFPDPARFIQWLHARGMSTALNLHPASGVWRHESMYKEYAEFLGAVDMAKRGSPIPFDLSTDLSAAAYFKVLLHPHEEMGDYEKSFWWIDWQQGAQSRLEGIDPLFQLNHLHFLDLARGGGKRPGVFSRFAGLGSHRYPIGFSGDTWATWESLAFQPFMTASASNANYFYWSHDIGGHTREIPNNGELYARWVQFGCWSPILRLHSSNNPYIFRNPWTYSEEVCTAAKNAMRRRHELVPYIFSCVYRAHVESVPLVMPMYYTHSEEEAAYAVSAQYWFGSELIVAPFVTPKDETTNLARQVVWLPGTDADSKSPIKAPWRDLHTGEAFTAGCFHSVYAGSLDYVPVFAKPGGIIPCAPPSAGSGQELNSVDSPETVCLTVVAGDDGKFELYEDEETGDQRKFITDIQLDWESSTNCTLRISGIANVNDRGSKIRVENDSDLQGVVPPSRTWKVTMLGVSGGSQVAIANQEEAAVAEYDAERESLSFTVSDVSVLQNISVSVCAGSETELLSTRDRRLEKMTQYLKTFAVGREVVWNLSGRLNEILENVSALRSVNEATSNVIIQDRFGTYWTVSPAMKRVLFETVSGDGCDRSFLSRQGAPAIAWKRPNSSVSIVTVEGKQVELGSSGYKVFWPSDEDTASTVEVTHADIVTVSLPLRDLVDNLPWPAPAVTNTAEKK